MVTFGYDGYYPNTNIVYIDPNDLLPANMAGGKPLKSKPEPFHRRIVKETNDRHRRKEWRR